MSSDFAIFGRNIPEKICSMTVITYLLKTSRVFVIEDQPKSWSVTDDDTAVNMALVPKIAYWYKNLYNLKRFGIVGGRGVSGCGPCGAPSWALFLPSPPLPPFLAFSHFPLSSFSFPSLPVEVGPFASPPSLLPLPFSSPPLSVLSQFP